MERDDFEKYIVCPNPDCARLYCWQFLKVVSLHVKASGHLTNIVQPNNHKVDVLDDTDVEGLIKCYHVIKPCIRMLTLIRTWLESVKCINMLT